MLASIIFLIFIAATSVQLFFWLGIFSRLAFYQEGTPASKEKEEGPPVSVIICARNEAENLRRFLPHILNQNYRSFEIVVVNDNSSDHTAKILLNFQRKKANLAVVNINKPTLPGKKAALSLGIEAAAYELILLTDADCLPSSPNWLRSMQAKLRRNTEIIIGYSPFFYRPGLLNLFIRFEGIYTAIQYLSFSLAGVPYMGVGRNLMYKRSLFLEKGTFSKHADIASGDDDLFINEAASKANTTVNLDPEAFIYSVPKSSWRGYYHQKSRHLTTGIRYKLMHKVMLGSLSTSHFLHYLCAFFLIPVSRFNELVILLILVRVGVVFFLYRLILKKFIANKLLKWAPILDAIYIFFYVIFAPSLVIGNKKRWK